MRPTYFKSILSLLVFFSYFICLAQDQNKTRIIEITTKVQQSPAALIFTWPAIIKGTQVSIFRKAKNALDWNLNQPLATLPGNATKFTDNTVVEGLDYEYFFRGFGEDGNPYTYIYGGVNVAQVDYRGKLILLVDDRFSGSLNLELKLLESDIIGDGWQVIRHNVSSSALVTDVKDIIKTEYTKDPQNVKAVFLFGNIPVPYSGEIAWDSHPDHSGAWPSDGYYADMVGTWTDNVASTVQARRSENKNIIGDGKFDQNYFPALTTLQIGRVDLSKMNLFVEPEETLLRNYLNKNHKFKHKLFFAEPRAVIDNNFGLDGFDASYYASCGWRSFVSMFTTSNITNGDFFTNTTVRPYLWAYFAGGGTYSSAQGVGTTTNFASRIPKAVFNMSFGSYFGDWDSSDNFLRAPLASEGWGLSNCWAGRPYWINHHTALGETLGYSAWITMRNTCYQSDGPNSNPISINLMGDPTLRIHPVAPPAKLLVINKQLTWEASAETVLAYCIYRKNVTTGKYDKIGTTTNTTYEDVTANADINYYMVRAQKLETSNSGSYYNLSQGVFGFTGNTLPLQLTTYTVKLNNQTVVNYWETKNQVNVNHINVQRSTDGINFNTIEKITVKPEGSYTFIDNRLPNTGKTLYYRLQIIDNNADEQLSNVLAVNLKFNSFDRLSVYPNPIISKQFSIKLNQLPKGDYKISLTNLIGKCIKEISFYYDGLTLTKSIDANFETGLYLLNINSSNYSEVRKLIVE